MLPEVVSLTLLTPALPDFMLFVAFITVGVMGWLIIYLSCPRT